MTRILIEKLRECLLEKSILLIIFAKCTRLVKLRLFRSYCLCFYGISLWTNFSVASHKKFRSCYDKCMNIMFFGYCKYASVTQMLLELGLPSCDTVLFNAKVRFTDSYNRCDNNVVHAFSS